MKIKIKLSENATMPKYAHSGDAGVDLCSTADLSVFPHCSTSVNTGVSLEIPQGYVGLVFPRSGLGSQGITQRNCVGVIDSGYRGEIHVCLWNTTSAPFKVTKGMRIAQLVIVPRISAEFEQVDELENTERGVNGFGSSGLH